MMPKALPSVGLRSLPDLTIRFGDGELRWLGASSSGKSARQLFHIIRTLFVPQQKQSGRDGFRCRRKSSCVEPEYICMYVFPCACRSIPARNSASSRKQIKATTMARLHVARRSNTAGRRRKKSLGGRVGGGCSDDSIQ